MGDVDDLTDEEYVPTDDELTARYPTVADLDWRDEHDPTL